MSKIDTVMAEYKAYLERGRLVKAQYIPYFINWVRHFLAFAKKHHGKTFDEVYAMFGESLGKKSHIGDWQIRQALDAVRIYGYQFRAISASTQSQDSDLAYPLRPEVITQRLREIVRLRHYAYRTEKTYIYWTQRFLKYCLRTGIDSPISEREVKAFLTHLALEQNVSASTQNQAFNALLMLCREILHVDLTEMSKNVRAKRGRGLPVVLRSTPAGMRESFS